MVLEEIVYDLRIHFAMAWQFIMIFSFSYAIFAPITASLTTELHRKIILLIALVLLVLWNIMSALSHTFFTVVLGRVIAASWSLLVYSTDFGCINFDYP
ncbi:MAG: hypothetical protein ACMUEM_01500 [Flavobacteriales bacterium AspAUS03]